MKALNLRQRAADLRNRAALRDLNGLKLAASVDRRMAGELDWQADRIEKGQMK